MTVKRIIVSCAVVLLTVAGLSAARSDVADAVMKGDTAARARALEQKRGRQRPSGRRVDGAPLGGLPVAMSRRRIS